MIMDTVLICPKCGRKSSDVAFMEAFCAECYPVNVKVPGKISITACKRCSRMLLGGEWVPYSEKAIGRYVAERCRGGFSDADYDLQRQVAVFTVRRGESEVKVERAVPVEVLWTTCRECSKVSGGYFEAIVQLRGDEAKVAKYREKFIAALSKKTFIAKEKPEKAGGIDLYIGSSRAVFGLMQELGLDAKITRKLVGAEQGKRKYRTTFAIRL